MRGVGSQGRKSFRAHFNGGTLCAGNIELSAEWIIGSCSEPGRIRNPGRLKMSGFLTISNATERFGRFVLASNAVIHLAGTCTSLSFADSSSEEWSSNAILVVTDSSDGSSGANQLKFGTNQLGLRPDQLAKIRFRALDPSRLFTVKILNTGEIVPDQPLPGAVRIVEENHNVILDWEPGWRLQTTTNVAGPYEDLPEIMPPYTHNFSAEPKRFFRLR